MKLMQEMPNTAENNAEDKRVYELGYLLVPTVPAEDVPALYTGLKDTLASLGGEAISDEMPKLIPLAYTITKVTSNVRHKFDSGYFGWVKFYMNADKVLELKKKADLDPNIIRFLIIKTVKENTMASKRYVGRDSAYRKQPKREVGEDVAPINKEEIDKEIDAMVAV